MSVRTAADKKKISQVPNLILVSGFIDHDWFFYLELLGRI
jgi:hypothetical protein